MLKKERIKRKVIPTNHWYENVYAFVISQTVEDYINDYKERLGEEGNAERYLFDDDRMERQLTALGYGEGLITRIRKDANERKKRRLNNETIT